MIGAFGGFLVSIILVYGIHLNDWWLLWSTLIGIGVEFVLRLMSGNNAPGEAIGDTLEIAVIVVSTAINIASSVSD